MTWSSTVSHTPASKRRQVLVLLVLLAASRALCDDSSNATSESCCGRQPSRSCRLYMLLKCGLGGGRGGALGAARPLDRDAAAGILTLGRREAEEQHYQSRLHQLLRGGARNQAAGILTMGKRAEEEEAVGLLMHWALRAQDDFAT